MDLGLCIDRFDCDAGYRLDGSREIQCQDEGTWDPHMAACSFRGSLNHRKELFTVVEREVRLPEMWPKDVPAK
ncbi:hypothetical protein Y1Q_0016593 [Alligator mississippiensis]|uniref:Sushi domain-containing protein n=1 Tax=Alligator mississippiensis TaxID=8496 RepID=A0A151MJR2_ALLMI|nr:hypothetical protein Y1Q_0016593 [Alligator mississippiensis]